MWRAHYSRLNPADITDPYTLIAQPPRSWFSFPTQYYLRALSTFRYLFRLIHSTGKAVCRTNSYLHWLIQTLPPVSRSISIASKNYAHSPAITECQINYFDCRADFVVAVDQLICFIFFSLDVCMIHSYYLPMPFCPLSVPLKIKLAIRVYTKIIILEVSDGVVEVWCKQHTVWVALSLYLQLTHRCHLYFVPQP